MSSSHWTLRFLPGFTPKKPLPIYPGSDPVSYPKKEDMYVGTNLENLSMEQLLLRYGDKANITPLFQELYQSNDFWKQYYEINFASSTIMVVRDCTDDDGQVNYFAACNVMNRMLNLEYQEDGTPRLVPLITALAAGADRYIIKYNLKPSYARDTYVHAAIASGNKHCLAFFENYRYTISHLTLAGDTGAVELYEYIHDYLLSRNMLARRYDTKSNIFDICCVRDDITTFDQKIHSNPFEFYLTAIRTNATKILKRLLQLYLQPEINICTTDMRSQLFQFALENNASLEILRLLSPYNQVRPMNLDLSACPLVLLEFLHEDRRINPVIDYLDLLEKLDQKRSGFESQSGSPESASTNSSFGQNSLWGTSLASELAEIDLGLTPRSNQRSEPQGLTVVPLNGPLSLPRPSSDNLATALWRHRSEPETRVSNPELHLPAVCRHADLLPESDALMRRYSDQLLPRTPRITEETLPRRSSENLATIRAASGVLPPSPLSYITTPIPRLNVGGTPQTLSPRIRTYSPQTTPRGSRIGAITRTPSVLISPRDPDQELSPRHIQASYLTINIIAWLITRYPPDQPEKVLQRLINNNAGEDFIIIMKALSLNRNITVIFDKLSVPGSFLPYLTKSFK